LAERRTHDYVRRGVTSLFAALEVATGKVTGRCFDRHRHSEFLAFLKLVARRHPRRELQVVLDNYGTHKPPAVRGWLNTHPRVRLHFTPTSASWMNQVETFFGAAHPPSDPPRHPPQRPGSCGCHPPLHRRLEQRLSAVLVGQRRRQHHDKGNP
jgi:DDE superfamily endonuclease